MKNQYNIYNDEWKYKVELLEVLYDIKDKLTKEEVKEPEIKKVRKKKEVK